MNNFTIVFYPLKNKKAIKIFLLSAIIISVIYLLFSIALSLFSTTPFPKGNLIEVILFGGFKAFSTFIAIDWIILALFPLFGGLLFANYSYWKCKTSKTANTGLVAGLFAATCPACILPVLGIFSSAAFLASISIYIKIGALILLIGATYFVANKQNKCNG